MELNFEPGQSCSRTHVPSHYIIFYEYSWVGVTPACTMWTVPKEPISCFLDLLCQNDCKEQIGTEVVNWISFCVKIFVWIIGR